MTTVHWDPLLRSLRANPRLPHNDRRKSRSGFSRSRIFVRSNRTRTLPIVSFGLAQTQSIAASDDAGGDVLFSETFPVKRPQLVEGKVFVRLAPAADVSSRWRLSVGCDLQGIWILHWGVTYCDDHGREWDQPPHEMRPPGSVAIKDYAIETPLKKCSSSSEGRVLYEVQVDIDTNIQIQAIHFVLKEEETGSWFQHKGRDFRVPLTCDVEEGKNTAGRKQGFNIWSGTFSLISSLLLRGEGVSSKPLEADGKVKASMHQNRCLEEFYEEYSIMKDMFVQNYVTVTVKASKESDKNVVHFDTDVPGDVVLHWGICRDNHKRWEIPPAPHPPSTKIFRQKALQTLLQQKSNGLGSWGLCMVDKEISGVPFVLKLNDYTWLNNVGVDFYVPLTSSSSSTTQGSRYQTITEQIEQKEAQLMSGGLESSGPSVLEVRPSSVDNSRKVEETEQPVDRVVNEIRNLVTDISSEKGNGTKSKEEQESILREIEKLAAEAYSIFRSSILNFSEEPFHDTAPLKPASKVCSGTGSGYEILCQGFNWESHKSGRWYSELNAKASELSSLGFTIIWLPPPTESVSPEGYMPKDLYNLNSRYGSIEELKKLVERLHEVGIKVLGDVVLNHRCAHYQNKDGIWNMFGGRLNWDERAIVADDPHFQGRGNKSSGDNFHAAPNIDHSQDFVRKDLKEWLCWLRKEVGYDGWRLDFVRGFWGGYVKDYMETTEPYFAVGEYWDSLSYTYDEMDHNQDAHRQRIIDWMNASNGTAGAFDVTTKGILHAALERCEYWRLSDQKGKPPGVVGWWPSRAVTFIENHDTGSTQGHWRFPSGKEMQGYAYILTHPGTPAVFYDHIFSHYHEEVSRLLSIRNRNKIHCRSTITITKAEKAFYAAEIDEKVTVKIGPGFYEPSNGPKRWTLAAEGKDYKVWESS